jgi:hypothetical protein
LGCCVFDVFCTASFACSFANSHRGFYWDKCSKDAKNFYPSHCYMDDLAWAAAWLNWATGEAQYLKEAAQ